MPRPVRIASPRLDALPGRAGALLPGLPVHADPRPVARSGRAVAASPAPPPSPRIKEPAHEPGVLLIGIDPGVSGGLCWWGPSYLVKSPTSYHRVTAEMPATLAGLWDVLEERVRDADQEGWTVRCIVEQVGGFIGGAHKDKTRPDTVGEGRENHAAAHTTFTFGRNYGQIEAFLVALSRCYPDTKLVYRTPVPQRWQRTIMGDDMRRKGETSPQWKSRLAAKARELAPDLKFNKPQADAVLLCHFARYHWNEVDDGSGESGKALPPRKGRRRV